jgi:hypothetical protein
MQGTETATLTTPCAAHDEDRIHDALAIRDDAFGRTLVATRAITVGTLLVRELPLVLAESTLPRDTMMALLEADLADAGMVDSARFVHGFLRADVETQEVLLRECCGEEGFGSGAHILGCATSEMRKVADERACAEWLVQHDPHCANASPERLARALCIYVQNSFPANNGLSGSVHAVLSKMAHRCLRRNCLVEGNMRSDGRLTVRCVRPIAQGEALSINYAEMVASSRCRRDALLFQRGFYCGCDDCAGADELRCVPCPTCQPRDATTGLLERRGGDGFLQRLVPAPDPSDDPLTQEDEPAAHRPSAAVAWRCDTCGLECTDAAVDSTTVCAPDDNNYDEWPGSAGRVWPLPLPSGSLLLWERRLEDIVVRMR